MAASAPGAAPLDPRLAQDLEDARRVRELALAGGVVPASFCSLSVCVRHLRQHRGHVAKAAQAVTETFQWRQEFGADSITQEQLASVMDGRMRVGGGVGVGGASLLVNIKSEEPTTDHDLAMRLLVFSLDAAAAAADARTEAAVAALALDIAVARRGDGAEATEEEREEAVVRVGPGQWVWLMCLARYSSASSPPLSVSIAAAKALAAHWPERLAAAVIVDAPLVFQVLWSAVSPLLDEKTRSKIRFLQSDATVADDGAGAAAAPAAGGGGWWWPWGSGGAAAPPSAALLRRRRRETVAGALADLVSVDQLDPHFGGDFAAESAPPR